MKKVVTILMLPVFLFSIIGWQWIFFLKLSSCEENEWSSEEEGGIEVIVVSQANSRETFLINDHELIHHGALFDVKWSEKREGSLVCYCERDNDEEELLSSFDMHTKNSFGHSHSSKPKSHRTVKVSLFENAVAQPEVKNIYCVSKIAELVRHTFTFSAYSDCFFVPPDKA